MNERYHALPLMQYEASDDARRQLSSAFESRIASCMQGAGYRYEAGPYLPDLPNTLWRWMGVSDLRSAETIGFDPKDIEESPVVDDANRRSNFDQAGYDRALLGAEGNPAPRSAGCSAIAQESTFGYIEWQRGRMIQSELWVESTREAEVDVAVLQAGREWERCMRHRGFDIPETDNAPWRAFESKYVSFPDGWWPAQQEARREVIGEYGDPSEAEKDAAVASVHCKIRTGLLDIWLEEVHQIQVSQVRLHRAELEEFDDLAGRLASGGLHVAD